MILWFGCGCSCSYNFMIYIFEFMYVQEWTVEEELRQAKVANEEADDRRKENRGKYMKNQFLSYKYVPKYKKYGLESRHQSYVLCKSYSLFMICTCDARKLMNNAWILVLSYLFRIYISKQLSSKAKWQTGKVGDLIKMNRDALFN